MEYHEAADLLFDLRRFRPSPGTASTAALLEELGDPHEDLVCVQIAGSNGKGSTARMVERVIREAGLSVGLYTSPHLEDLRERVRVDGRKIPRSAVADFVEEIEEYAVDRAAEDDSPTFFEAMTALALWRFGRADVDVAVLEVGIGGKYDATSVVDPVASAVTSVTLEHTSVLGDTHEEIARDKAHVAPDGRPLVTGVDEESVLEALREVAGSVETVGRGNDRDVSVAYGGRTNRVEAAVSIDGDGWDVDARLPLLGAHQAENAAIAAVVARQVAGELDLDIPPSTIARGLGNAHWPGRFEVIDTDPLVVLDGAHNPGACERVAETLGGFAYDDLHLVFGAMHDKDHRGMARALPDPDSVRTCEPNLPRAEDRAVLARVFERAGVDAGRIEEQSAVADALAGALDDADEGDAVVVTGSLFAVAEARRRYTHTTTPKRVRNREEAHTVLESASVSEAGVERATESAIHRVLTTRVQYRQATTLERELARLGGECAISGFKRDDELVDVVLMGTDSELSALVAALQSEPHGLGEIAREVRATVEENPGSVSNRSSASGYPWEGEGTAVMGILNTTPDSFHDGGEYETREDALARAEAMVEAGADVIDVGGESTRPGADPVSVDEEIERVVPVIEGIGDRATVSVDTRKAAVAEAAVGAGADVINDVSGLEDPRMRFVAADHDVPLIVMHSIDAPVVPGKTIEYDDVVGDAIDELRERILLAEKAGLDRERIVVDPGIGFGKSAAESFELLDRLGEFRALGCPILVGHSHKSMFERAGCGPDDRGVATVAATALAADRGADIVRVHDVPENVAAVRTALATREGAAFRTDR
ncbi:dihydropteroate synthase [Saliphagus sp. LR7]|uniref:dihydropteroate synthase n=1 Tax=Saliphagus sp. LR7 TaxID=2282654 RepID=UPI000DF74BC3|nr:dihydropteroate synthase [Saliphagus sp. LR7]